MTADADRRRAHYSDQMNRAQNGLFSALGEASDHMSAQVTAAVTEFIAREAAARADYWSAKLAEQASPDMDGQQVMFGPGNTAEQPALKDGAMLP